MDCYKDNLKTLNVNMAYNNPLTILEIRQRTERFQLYEFHDNSFYLYWNVVNDKIPEDIVAIRSNNKSESMKWRMLVREQFLQAFEKGGQVVGFSTNSEYVVRI
jgi:predicted GNAT superfamily acetyltransferase